MAVLPQSFLRRELPVLPSKRLLAIDPGAHSFKLLLVEDIFGRVRTRRHELLDLQEEGLLAEDEVVRHAQLVIQEMGTDPIALALPHYRALSQIVDLPPAEPRAIRRLIEEETVKLSGLGESSIVYDYVGLRPFSGHPNPFWVTLCPEGEVQAQLGRCAVANLDLCEVTTAANALIAAFQATQPEREQAVLADVGSSGTVVAILHDGQGVYAGSFPTGGDAVTEALAAQLNCGFAAADQKKRALDLTQENAETAVATGVLRAWHAELKRILDEWRREHAELGLELESFPVFLCGGASLQAGLVERLNRFGPLRFELWPEPPDLDWSIRRFAVAYGTAVQALGRHRQSASLLPSEVRVFWKRQHTLNLLHSLTLFVLALVSLALGLGTWQKLELIHSKQRLMDQSDTALGKALATERLAHEWATNYGRLRPLLQRQRRCLDTLQTLALLQETRSNQAFWYVLFADRLSYANTPLALPTNAPPATNLTSAAASLPLKPGFVAELCVPEEGEGLRRTLSQLVVALKRSSLFRNVDSLPADQQRGLADTNVFLPGRLFALQFELAESPLREAEPAGPRPPLAPGKTAARSPTRPAPGVPDRLTEEPAAGGP